MVTELLPQNHTHASQKATLAHVLRVMKVRALHHVLTLALAKNLAIRAHVQLATVLHALVVILRHVVHVALLNQYHDDRSNTI
jgi:hypothetical protein